MATSHPECKLQSMNLGRSESALELERPYVCHKSTTAHAGATTEPTSLKIVARQKGARASPVEPNDILAAAPTLPNSSQLCHYPTAPLLSVFP